MKYLIMETHPGYCVALDEKGAFFRIANFGYETGDVVYDVVMMKDAAKSSGSRRIKKMYAIAAVAACFAFALIPAMSLLSQEEAEVQLSINPSVTMTVDEDNKVDDIEAGNEDGQDLLENYSGEGKNVNKVIGELVARAVDMGFLLEGETVNIDVGAEDGRRANSLSEDIGRYLKENLDGKYSLVITSNGMELINRHTLR